MNQSLLNLVLALAVNDLLHGIAEPMSARRKLKRLQTYIDKQPWTEDKLNINTRTKSYAISITVFVVITGIAFGVFSLLDLQGATALTVVAVLLVLANFVNGGLMDRWHVEMERVTKPFKDSGSSNTNADKNIPMGTS